MPGGATNGSTDTPRPAARPLLALFSSWKPLIVKWHYAALEQNERAVICDDGIAVKAQFLSCAGVPATFAAPLEKPLQVSAMSGVVVGMLIRFHATKAQVIGAGVNLTFTTCADDIA